MRTCDEPPLLHEYFKEERHLVTGVKVGIKFADKALMARADLPNQYPLVIRDRLDSEAIREVYKVCQAQEAFCPIQKCIFRAGGHSFLMTHHQEDQKHVFTIVDSMKDPVDDALLHEFQKVFGRHFTLRTYDGAVQKGTAGCHEFATVYGDVATCLHRERKAATVISTAYDGQVEHLLWDTKHLQVAAASPADLLADIASRQEKDAKENPEACEKRRMTQEELGKELESRYAAFQEMDFVGPRLGKPTVSLPCESLERFVVDNGYGWVREAGAGKEKRVMNKTILQMSEYEAERLNGILHEGGINEHVHNPDVIYKLVKHHTQGHPQCQLETLDEAIRGDSDLVQDVARKLGILPELKKVQCEDPVEGITHCNSVIGRMSAMLLCAKPLQIVLGIQHKVMVLLLMKWGVL